MARERGTDVFATERDVCLIVDETDGVALLIGGRGEAEQMVDVLLEEGHQLREVTYKGNEQFYNVLLHRGMDMCGVGIPHDDIDSIVFLPNKADFVDLRLYRPGVPKEKKLAEFSTDFAKRMAGDD